MSTIRDLFHSLGNKHTLVTAGGSATMKMLKNCLQAENLPEELKDIFSRMLKNLEWVVQGALEADEIRRELHDRIYQVIDPDTGKPKEEQKNA